MAEDRVFGDFEPAGLLAAGAKRVAVDEERNPLVQAYGLRSPAQHEYNDTGVVYVAPHIGGGVKSAHVALPEDHTRLAKFYAIAEGFDFRWDAKNSNGHVVSLAAATSLMDHVYDVLRQAENPREMMNELVRRVIADTQVKVLERDIENANLDLSLVAVLPGDEEGVAKWIAANLGGTNVLQYDHAENTYRFTFGGKSDGMQWGRTVTGLNPRSRGICILEGGEGMNGDEFPLTVAEGRLGFGSELYLLNFVADAWTHPRSVNKPIIGQALARGAKHINLSKRLGGDPHRRKPIRDVVHGLATEVSALDERWYGTASAGHTWWNSAVLGLRCVGEEETPDREAFWCNELVELAAEAEGMSASLGDASSSGIDASRMLPPAVRDLAKRDD